MKKVFKVLLWIVIATVLVGTFVFLFMNSREKTVTYEIVTPTKGDVERSTVLTGKIEPRDEIEIKPQISGIITEILVEPGDKVNNGDIIAKIKVIPDEGQLSQAQNRVQVARINLEQTKALYERTRMLYEKKYESREKLEADKATYDQAVAELAQANDQLTIVRDGVSASNAQGSNTLVRATVTGIVLEVPVKVGSSVIQSNTFNDGTTIAKIADMTDLIFKGKIDETEVDLLREGQPVKISVGAVAGSEMEAVIEKIAPMATDDNGTNTFEVKAALNPASVANLRAGYSANAAVVLEKAENAIIVPESIVEYSGDSSFVYILKEGKPQQEFARTAITTGVSDGINVAVTSGNINEHTRLRGAETKN